MARQINKNNPENVAHCKGLSIEESKDYARRAQNYGRSIFGEPPMTDEEFNEYEKNYDWIED